MDKTLKTLGTIVGTLSGSIPKEVPLPPTSPNYPLFLKENTISPDKILSERVYFGVLPRRFKKASVILGVCGRDDAAFLNTVLTVSAQTYPNIDLIVLSERNVPDIGEKGSLIRVTFFRTDIEGRKAYERVFNELRGYFMFLTAGDRLEPNAVSSLILCAEKTGADLVYADNDHYTEFGKRLLPFFKPAPSPVTETCFDYVKRPFIVSDNIIKEYGLPRSVSEQGLREYLVSIMTSDSNAVHVPELLASLPFPDKLTEESPFRISGDAEAAPGAFIGSMRILPLKAERSSVSVIIAAPKRVSDLRRCLESVDDRSTYLNYKLIVAAAADVREDMLEYLAALKRNRAAKIVISKQPGLSVPALLNLGASRSYSEYIVFLSGICEAVSYSFIEALLEPMLLKKVGVTGGKLKDKDGALLSCGEVIGLAGNSSSPYKGTRDDAEDAKKSFYTAMQRNVSAVSGALMAVRSDVFSEAGMFDDTLSEYFWDAEFCLRAAKAGHMTVYTPFAEANMMRASDEDDQPSSKNRERIRDVLKSYGKKDLYFSTHYDRRFTLPQLKILPDASEKED